MSGGTPTSNYGTSQEFPSEVPSSTNAQRASQKDTSPLDSPRSVLSIPQPTVATPTISVVKGSNEKDFPQVKPSKPPFLGFPPDHSKGWFVVAGAFIIQFCTFGLMNCYTTFTRLMEDDPSLGNPTKAELSVGSSVSGGIGPLLGVVAGYLTDRVGPKPLTVALGIGMAFAFLVGAQASSVTLLVLAYSLPFSVATACCNSPVATSVGSWFEKRLSIAMGITYCGGGVGAAVLPAIAGHLAAAYKDWRECWRILALFAILPMTVGTLLLRIRPPLAVRRSQNQDITEEKSIQQQELPRESDSLLEACDQSSGSHTKELPPFMVQLKRALKIALYSLSFWACSAVAWFFCYAYFGFLYVLIPYVMEWGHTGHYSSRTELPIARATTLYTFYGIFGAVGNIAMGFAGVALPTKKVFSLCSAFNCCAVIGLIFASEYWHLAVIVSLIGFTNSGCWNTVPALLVERFMGPDLGTVVGLGFCTIGIAALMSPPITAHLAASEGGDYTLPLSLMAASSAFGSVVCMVFVPEAPKPSW